MVNKELVDGVQKVKMEVVVKSKYNMDIASIEESDILDVDTINEHLQHVTGIYGLFIPSMRRPLTAWILGYINNKLITTALIMRTSLHVTRLQNVTVIQEYRHMGYCTTLLKYIKNYICERPYIFCEQKHRNMYRNVFPLSVVEFR
jgi:hypothetical protein